MEEQYNEILDLKEKIGAEIWGLRLIDRRLLTGQLDGRLQILKSKATEALAAIREFKAAAK